MQVNTDFYGLPETWIRNTTIDSTANTPEMYWFKVADINPDSASAFNRKSRLIDYINDNKIEFGEDIDPSICFAAMSGGPLVNVKMYNGVFDDNNVQSIKTTSTMFENPCGWFFATLTDVSPTGGMGFPGASYLTDNNYGYFDIIGQHYWKVDNKSITYIKANNVSASIQPIVEFNPRGMYLAIMITIFNKLNGSFTNYTMDQVRTNFANHNFDVNTHVIVRAYAEIYTRRGNTEAYYAADTAGANGLIAVPINHAIIGDHDVINYGYRFSQFTLMGWNGSNPSAYKFNHEGDTQSLNDGYYYPFQRCNSVTPPGDVNNAASTIGYIWINTQYNRFFQEAVYYNQGLGIVSYIEYNDENMEAVRKAAASFGLFFTEKAGSYFSTNPDKWIDIDMFCGVLDSNGVGYGEYTRGTHNRDNPIYNYTSSQESPYTPGGGGNDPNTYSNTTSFNSVTSNAALTKYYVLDAANVEKLGDDLWTICGELSADDFQDFDGKLKDEFLTTNPIDSIISLARFPFNIPHTFSLSKTAVQLGKSTGTAEGYRTYNVTFGVNFAGIDIYPRFGNCFLDYSPYTKYELYIPFCGTVEISPGDILGHKLNLQLLIDLITGSVIAYIMADQLVIGTAKGSCAIDIQMSGMETATMKANIFNGIIQANLADTQEALNVGSMVWPTGAIKTLLDPFSAISRQENAESQTQMANYSITHMIAPVHKMGSASPLLSWIQEFNARLMIFYPEGDVMTSEQPPSLIDSAVAAFGHIKGFATCTPGIVSDFRRSDIQCFTSGTIFADSIPCTSSERQRIISAFENGVYLPVISI